MRMTPATTLLLLLHSLWRPDPIIAFQQQNLRSCTPNDNWFRFSHSSKKQSKPPQGIYEPEKNPYGGPCQELDDDDGDWIMDRREAAFSMLGGLWAVGALPTFLVFPDAAVAAYGADAKMVLPNPLESMTDRATKQCIVESLGNRECLVYAGDAADRIYQGVESKVLLERVEKASIALASIPPLVEKAKWSQVTGILTGPMGELIRTMGQLAELSENAVAAKDKIKVVKTDLYSMQAAVDRKDSAKVIQSHQAATKDLVAFVKAL